MTKTSIAFIAVLAAGGLGAHARTAHALDPALCDLDGKGDGGACYGLELTFADPPTASVKMSANENFSTGHDVAAQAWLKEMRTRCSDSAVCWIEPFGVLGSDPKLSEKCAPEPDQEPLAKGTAGKAYEFRVCYPGKVHPWFYEVTYDPGVLEIKTYPTNRRSLMALKKRFTDDIFGAATAAGLQTASVSGGGQVHVDVDSAFGATPEGGRRLLNFMNGIYNLRLFPLSPDVSQFPTDAPPLIYNVELESGATSKAVHGQTDRVLTRNVADSYRGFLKSAAGKTPQELLDLLKKIPNFGSKYLEINPHTDKGTIELRNIDDMLSVTEMYAVIDVLDQLIQGAAKSDQVDLLTDDQIRITLVATGANQVRIKDEHAVDIATRFRALVGNDPALCAVRRFLPPQVEGVLATQRVCN